MPLSGRTAGNYPHPPRKSSSLGGLPGSVVDRAERVEILEHVPAAGMCNHELYKPGNRARKCAGARILGYLMDPGFISPGLLDRSRAIA